MDAEGRLPGREPGELSCAGRECVSSVYSSRLWWVQLSLP